MTFETLGRMVSPGETAFAAENRSYPWESSEEDRGSFARLKPREQDLAKWLFKTGKTVQLDRLLKRPEKKESTPRLPCVKRPPLRPLTTNEASPPVRNVTLRRRGCETKATKGPTPRAQNRRPSSAKRQIDDQSQADQASPSSSSLPSPKEEPKEVPGSSPVVVSSSSSSSLDNDVVAVKTDQKEEAAKTEAPKEPPDVAKEIESKEPRLEETVDDDSVRRKTTRDRNSRRRDVLTADAWISAKTRSPRVEVAAAAFAAECARQRCVELERERDRLKETFDAYKLQASDVATGLAKRLEATFERLLAAEAALKDQRPAPHDDAPASPAVKEPGPADETAATENNINDDAPAPEISPSAVTPRISKKNARAGPLRRSARIRRPRHRHGDEDDDDDA